MLAKELRSFFEKQDVKKKLIDLDQEIQAKNFWNNREEAEKVLKKKKNYSTLFDSYNYFEKENKDLYDIFLLAKDENASNIEACFEDPLLAINIFKDVVFSYNIDDEFLCIKEDSIVELFNREPEDVITFDVDQKFRFDLLKVNSIYKLKLFPPGGIYGDWNNFNKDPLNEDILPVVQYSQFSQNLITKKL